MRGWMIILLAICLVASLALNALLSLAYPVDAQPEQKIVYVEVPVSRDEARTGHVGLFVRQSPAGDELNYQVFWLQGERWVSANSQPTLCDNRLDARSAWLSLPEWQRAQVAEICEVTR